MKKWYSLALVLLAMRAFILKGQIPRHPPGRGYFLDIPPEVQLLEDGRQVKLLKTIYYIDPKSSEWRARTGLISDGASIPRAMWSIVGAPLDGLYRNAALIHDQACDDRIRTWQDTHRAFYEAMLDSNVSTVKAKEFYWAVLLGGPRWQVLYNSSGEPQEIEKKKQEFEARNDPSISLQTRKLILAGPEVEQLIVVRSLKTPQFSIGKFKKKAREIESREKLGNPISATELEQLAPPDPTP